MESAFKSQLAHEFERVLIYESPALQEKARQVLPIQEMHELARKNLSTVNSAVGKGEKPLDFQVYCLLQFVLFFISNII